MRLLLLLLVLASACGRVIDDDPGPAPTAEAGAAAITVFVGDEVSFDGSASSGFDTLTWDFGDGGEAEGEVVSHVFVSAGGFVVTLTASSGSSTATDSIVVTVAEPRPTAAFTVNPQEPHAGDVVSFDASTSSGPALITTASWNFGDGAEGEGAVASHAFAAAGTYRVRLTVTDADGATDEEAVDVVVSNADVSGTWDVAGAAFSCANYSVSFPDDVLVLTQTGDDVTATGEGGRAYSGSFDADGLPLRGPATINTGACGSAVVDVNWRAALTGPDRLEGRATAFFDLDVGCQCTAAWTLTATRR